MVLVKQAAPGAHALGRTNGLVLLAQCLGRALAPAFARCAALSSRCFPDIFLEMGGLIFLFFGAVGQLDVCGDGEPRRARVGRRAGRAGWARMLVRARRPDGVGCAGALRGRLYAIRCTG